MCGILGICRTRNEPPVAEADVVRMRDLMVHRGPDDQGSKDFEGGRIWLAHRRLSILDLTPAGHQPMACSHGRYWITFNGEVFNFQEIRADLEAAGYRFRSHCDTEVILAAYDHWGPECLPRFNGMWALAIWDTVEKKLFITRDRFAIKPLYYYHNGQTLIFASELRSILASNLVQTRVNPQAVGEYLLTGNVDGTPESFFAGIHRFPPGHYGCWQDGTFSIHRYWSLPSLEEPFPRQPLSEDQISEYRHLFEDSVRLRMISDVPVGTCLSGGLDSSSIFATASRQNSHPLKTFSSFFTEGIDFDERSFFNLVAKQYNADRHIVHPQGERLFELLPRIIWHLEEPPKAMGVFPQWHVMELASRQVTVLLDGQGGDEVLAGYDPYLLARFRELARRRAYGQLWREYRLANHHVRPLDVLRSVLPMMDGLARRAKQAVGDDFNIYAGPRVREHRAYEPTLSSRHADRVNAVLARDVEYNMLPALLKYEDKLGMAFSIEARVPLLDYRLVNLAFSQPSDTKYADGWSKYILRRSMEGILPREIQWRKDKKGFPTPTKVWFAGPLFEQLLHQLGNGRAVQEGWLSRTGVQTLLEQNRRGARDVNWLLWRLLSLEQWLGISDRLTCRDLAQPVVQRKPVRLETQET